MSAIRDSIASPDGNLHRETEDHSIVEEESCRPNDAGTGGEPPEQERD